ncbi:unnamed protein product [Effrenium voratum]|nr:unnamed protein product [Effrenium voratum]
MSELDNLCFIPLIILWVAPFVALMLSVAPFLTSPLPIMGVLLPILGFAVSAVLYLLPRAARAGSSRVAPEGYAKTHGTQAPSNSLEVESCSDISDASMLSLCFGSFAKTGLGHLANWGPAMVDIIKLHEAMLWFHVDFRPNLFVYNAALAACAHGAAWQSALSLLRRPEWQPDVKSFGACAHALRARPTSALRLLKSMAAARLAADAATHSAVATACERGFRWQVALDLLSTVPLDQIAHGTLLSALARGACWLQAIGIWQSLGCMGAESLVLTGAVITACERGHHWAGALAVFNRMLEEGPRPDTVITDSVLRASSRGLAWEAGLSLFSAMPSLRLELGAMGYSAAVLALGCGKQWGPALELLEEMHHARLAADVSALSTGLGEAEQRGLQDAELRLLGSLRFAVPGRLGPTGTRRFLVTM